MVKPGNWYIELDDGTGADRHTEIGGAAKLQVGDVIGPTQGHRWRLDRVDQAGLYAHAVPAD